MVRAYAAEEMMGDEPMEETRPLKRVADSLTEATRIVRHEDIGGFGRLFGGRLMEWIDEAAGICAMRHCGGTITTASVDNLEFKNPGRIGQVLHIDSRITYVGRTSMEVRTDSFVEDVTTGERKLINRAYLTEVHIDQDGNALEVPYGLELVSDEDREEWEDALKRREMRRMRSDGGY